MGIFFFGTPCILYTNYVLGTDRIDAFAVVLRNQIAYSLAMTT